MTQPLIPAPAPATNCTRMRFVTGVAVASAILIALVAALLIEPVALVLLVAVGTSACIILAGLMI